MLRPQHCPQKQVQSDKMNLCIQLCTQMLHILRLAWPQLMSNRSTKGPHGHAGKLHYLQEQMRHFRLNCLAVQEARSEAGASSVNGILRLCGGHHDGHLGIEIWIDLTTPYAWSKQNKPRCFTKAHFQCVHHDPRRMLVRSDAPDMSFWLLALHAPHSGHSLQTRQAWWEETSELMRQHYDGDVLFVLGDTNAAPGNRDGHHSAPGWLFHVDQHRLTETSFLQSSSCTCQRPVQSIKGPTVHGLTSLVIACIASTMSRCRKFGNTVARGQAFCKTLTLPRFMMIIKLQQYNFNGQSGLDVAENHGLADHNTRPARIIMHQVFLIKLPNFKHYHGQLMLSNRHNILRNSCMKVIQQQQPHTAPKIKKTYITERLWNLRKDKCYLKKSLKQIKQRAKRDLLYKIFQAWTGKLCHDQQPEYFNYECMLRCNMISKTVRLHVLSTRLKQEIICSKRQALKHKIEEFTVTTPASEVLRELKHFIGPTNPKKHKKKMLPIVRDEQG